MINLQEKNLFMLNFTEAKS